MAASIKAALADAGIDADAVASADAPAGADADAPVSAEPSFREQARAQAGAGVRSFVLAPGKTWVQLYSPEGRKCGRIGTTLGRNDVYTASYVPEGGRIAEIPLYAILEADAAGAFD